MPGDRGVELAGSVGVALSFHTYAEHVPGAVWIGGVPWHDYDHVLLPLCMPHVALEVNRKELREAMSQNRAYLACWTSEWDRRHSSEWWWVACDRKDYSVENVPSSRGRADIRKGLRECSVRRLEPGEFSHLAYPIHRAALEGYGTAPPTGGQFTKSMQRLAEYPGTDFWAAFRDDVMVAFVVYQVIDGAVSGIIAKSNPEFHKYQPNAAMFYTACQHYMAQGLLYVTGGSRTLVHPSAIQDFSEKLGWRRVFCRVNVELSPLAEALERSRIVRWGPSIGLCRLLGPKWHRLEGFDRLMTIADTFR